MTNKELMQMALDALEKHIFEYETTQALRARLAEPEETVTFGLPTCPRCGKANPAEIHTCTPQEPN